MKWKSGVVDKTLCLTKQLGSVGSYKGTAFHEMVGQYMQGNRKDSFSRQECINNGNGFI